MEPDRYQENHQYYIVGIICLVFGLSLFALSIYILPFLAFDWHYVVPDFIISWLSWFQFTYKSSNAAASWLVFLILFIPSLVLIIIADILSNRIDNQIYGITPQTEQKRIEESDDKESNRLIITIVAIIVLVFIAAEFFQWFITMTA